jgi:hypothetical protein
MLAIKSREPGLRVLDLGKPRICVLPEVDEAAVAQDGLFVLPADF